ncbi:alpha/beta fold hydrolase [Bradyrhizobium sp. HKCCYLS20291]|uniref:alpha/beta fold hydrolase n=1 Tax=Bradyrhizobium sp. HKCCYLS20291 TaxID=3420766 RepID=UPI003EB6CC3E
MHKCLIATLFWAAIMLPAQAQAPWQLPPGIKSIEVNGYPMAYQEAGSGTPVLLVHGSMNDYRYWSPQIEAFAGQHRVIAVSLRHFFPERWDGNGSDFSIIQHADDVAELIRKLDLGPVHLLGHSRGGAVVLNVAARHPEVIKTLMLADASGMETLLPDSSQSGAADGRKLRDEFAAHLAKGDREGAIKGFVEALNGPKGWDELSQEEKTILLDNIGTAMRPEQRPSLSCEVIAKFQFPVLLLNGEKSPKRYAEMFEAMRKCSTTNVAEAVVIRGASHAMNRQEPAVFNAVVEAFLSGR